MGWRKEFWVFLEDHRLPIQAQFLECGLKTSTLGPNELQSKLPRGGYMGDDIGAYYRGYQGEN